MQTINAPQVIQPDIPTSASGYTQGDCTYGVSQIYPQINQYMGNAGTWIDSARKLNYTVVSSPVAGAIVVYGAGGGYSQFGHVAVVQSVVSPSTFEVIEMNYVNLWTWDQRLSDMTDVIGFIIPPGNPSTDTIPTAAMSQSQVTTPCVTFSWSIAGSNICFDGAIGAIAIGGGLLLLAVGAIVCVAFALGHTKAGKSATDALEVVGLSRAKQQRTATIDNEDMARAARLEAIRSRNLDREERRARAEDRLRQRNVARLSRNEREIRRRVEAKEEEVPF